MVIEIDLNTGRVTKSSAQNDYALDMPVSDEIQELGLELQTVESEQKQELAPWVSGVDLQDLLK